MPQMTDAQYVECAGMRCPFCQSTGVNSGSITAGADGRTATASVDCDDCGREWLDVYNLVGFAP